MKITIIGTGVYGIAHAIALSQNKNNKIIMWSESEDSLQKIESMHESYQPLNGINLPSSISFTTSYEDALEDTDLVFIMTAAKYVRSVVENMIPYINEKMCFVIGSKGIEQGTCLFVHEIFESKINTEHLAVLSGPSFAIDLARLDPIGLTLATKSEQCALLLYEAYQMTNVKLVRSNDMLGTELCGSIKNVIAIGSGILSGMGYAESTRSFLLVQALEVIKQLIGKLGGNEVSAYTLAGMGDLQLTATSEKSRNYSYGVLLGKNDIKAAQDMVQKTTVEGYYTLESIYSLLENKCIEIPLITIIYKIVKEHMDPEQLKDYLLH